MAEPTIEQRLEKLEAAQAIENIQARYDYYHSVHLHEERLPLFALDTPGVRVELDWGAYEGREGVERFFRKYQEMTHQPTPGALAIHTLTTPLIEVADDLQTAKAMWISPGVGSGVLPDAPPGTRPGAGWMWIRYSTDFVKEHGSWKIWHLNIKMILFAPYEKSWVEAEPPPARRQVPPGCEPDRVPENPVAGYAVDRVYEIVPPPPVPYATFDPATSY